MLVGQDEAIRQIVDVYQMHLAGLSPAGRPIGNFLFLGPTGSGKTRAVEAIAEVLLGNPNAVIKVDCAELQHSHEIAKLIGSPPGYLGHRETAPLLSQENLNRYQTETVKISFVLFDEIEKASDAVWNLLLGILDKAVLTLGDNRRVDFSRSMIFLTSNLGSSEMNALVNPGMGFGGAVPAKVPSGKVAQAGIEAARRKFTPEFINRLDKVVVFNPLGAAELERVLEIELKAVQNRIFAECGTPFGFSVTDGAKGFLLQEGTDARYGARHLRRAIERHVVQPLSNLVASEQVVMGDWIRVDYGEAAAGMLFAKEEEGISPQVLAALAESRGPVVKTTVAAVAAPRPVPAARPRIGEVNFGE